MHRRSWLRLRGVLLVACAGPVLRTAPGPTPLPTATPSSASATPTRARADAGPPLTSEGLRENVVVPDIRAHLEEPSGSPTRTAAIARPAPPARCIGRVRRRSADGGWLRGRVVRTSPSGPRRARTSSSSALARRTRLSCSAHTSTRSLPARESTTTGPAWQRSWSWPSDWRSHRSLIGPFGLRSGAQRRAVRSARRSTSTGWRPRSARNRRHQTRMLGSPNSSPCLRRGRAERATRCRHLRILLEDGRAMGADGLPAADHGAFKSRASRRRASRRQGAQDRGAAAASDGTAGAPPTPARRRMRHIDNVNDVILIDGDAVAQARRDPRRGESAVTSQG